MIWFFFLSFITFLQNKWNFFSCHKKGIMTVSILVCLYQQLVAVTVCLSSVCLSLLFFVHCLSSYIFVALCIIKLLLHSNKILLKYFLFFISLFSKFVSVITKIWRTFFCFHLWRNKYNSDNGYFICQICRFICTYISG